MIRVMLKLIVFMTTDVIAICTASDTNHHACIYELSVISRYVFHDLKLHFNSYFSIFSKLWEN